MYNLHCLYCNRIFVVFSMYYYYLIIKYIERIPTLYLIFFVFRKLNIAAEYGSDLLRVTMVDIYDAMLGILILI